MNTWANRKGIRSRFLENKIKTEWYGSITLVELNPVYEELDDLDISVRRLPYDEGFVYAPYIPIQMSDSIILK